MLRTERRNGAKIIATAVSASWSPRMVLTARNVNDYTMVNAGRKER